MNLVELLLALLILILLSATQQQFTRNNRLAWTAAMEAQDELAFLDSLETYACQTSANSSGSGQVAVTRPKIRGRTTVLNRLKPAESTHTLTCHSTAHLEATLRPVYCQVQPTILGIAELAFLCWEK